MLRGILGLVFFVALLGTVITFLTKNQKWKIWLAVMGSSLLIICLVPSDSRLAVSVVNLETSNQAPVITTDTQYIEGTSDVIKVKCSTQSSVEPSLTKLTDGAGQQYLIINLNLNTSKNDKIKYCGSFSNNNSNIIDKSGNKYPAVYWINTGIQFTKAMENEWGTKQVYLVDNPWLGEWQLGNNSKATLIFQLPSNSNVDPEKLELVYGYTDSKTPTVTKMGKMTVILKEATGKSS